MYDVFLCSRTFFLNIPVFPPILSPCSRVPEYPLHSLTVDEAYIVYSRVVITEIWVSKMLALTVLHAKQKTVLHAKKAKNFRGLRPRTPTDTLVGLRPPRSWPPASVNSHPRAKARSSLRRQKFAFFYRASVFLTVLRAKGYYLT